MKKRFISCLVLLACLSVFSLRAQFIAGTDGFFIQSGTTVFMDSLVLIPAPGDLEITEDELTISYEPVPGSPPSIKRIYNFNVGFNFAGTVGLFYQQTEVPPNEEEDLQVAHSGGGSFTVTTGSSVEEDDDYVQNSVSSVFLKSVTAATYNTLPVTLADFSVQREGNSVSLSWITASETNSASFEVQRLNGKNWQPLGHVAAAGRSGKDRPYFYTDLQPLTEPVLYYRLKMNDLDGSFSYSDIKSIAGERSGASFEMAFYPNPSPNRIQLKWTGSGRPERTDLFNLSGYRVYSFTGQGPAEGIDIKTLPAGVYMVRVTDSEGKVHQSRIVKP